MIIPALLQGNRLTRLDFLVDPCALSFTLHAFVKVRENAINCDCDVYSAIVTEYVHVDGRCSEPPKYQQYWLNPTIDSAFQEDAALECGDTVNVTGVVFCARDGTSGAARPSLLLPGAHPSSLPVTILISTLLTLTICTVFGL